MPIQLIFPVVVVFLFGICGWCGAIAFLHQGSEWILGITSPSLASLLFHENAIRGASVALFWGIFSIVPLYFVHGKKLQPIASFIYLPISMIVLCSGYLFLWPPERKMVHIQSLEILLAEGWKVFSISYIVWIFIPLSIWSTIERRSRS